MDKSIVMLAKELLRHSKVRVVTRDKRLAERLRKLGVDVEQDM